jgi:hypothetical protein
MRLNKNIYPPGGHMFIDTDGAKIFGDDWPGVFERVKQYRQRQGRPVGEVVVEVTTQACARAPSICHEMGATERRARVIASLKSRVLRWFRDLVHDGQFVTTETWKARADTCAKCPKNQPLPGGCSTCRAAVAELRKKVLDRRPNDGRLNACEVLGEDLPTAAHLERPAVDNPALPAECWRKKVI